MHHSMCVKLLELPVRGRQWDWQVPQKQLQDAALGAVVPIAEACSDAAWQGEIKRLGDVYELQGRWQLDVKRECSRCNASFVQALQGDCQREFCVGEKPDDDTENECEVLEPPGELDLLDVLREEIWLSWRQIVLCSSDCKGLCLGCGENLNLSHCRCVKDETDHPLAALRKLKFD